MSIIQPAVIVIAALLLVTQHVDGVSQWDSGAGIVYTLQVTQVSALAFCHNYSLCVVCIILFKALATHEL